MSSIVPQSTVHLCCTASSVLPVPYLGILCLSGDDCTLFTMEDDDLTNGLIWSLVFTCRQLRPTEIDWLPV